MLFLKRKEKKRLLKEQIEKDIKEKEEELKFLKSRLSFLKSSTLPRGEMATHYLISICKKQIEEVEKELYYLYKKI